MGFNNKLFIAVSLLTNKIYSSPGYTNYTLEESRVCSVTYDTKELSLGKENKSAIIVKDTYYFDDWSGRKEFDCRFTVKAYFSMGIFAVIQQMSLRKDPVTNECIDFIQFRPSPLSIRGKVVRKLKDIVQKPSFDSWDKTYCGELHPFDRPEPDKANPQLAVNGYVAEEGEMEVRIHVADRKVDSGKRIGVEMAFTSFLKCVTGNIGAYKSCGEDTCIYKEYFSDKIINCPFVTCKDEPECSAYVSETELLEKGLNTKVYITAVSSIFLSFFLFLGCIMLCRYFDLLCWYEAPQSTGRDLPTELEQVSPTAPPHQESPDKDLPPAYETLFPGSHSAVRYSAIGVCPE